MTLNSIRLKFVKKTSMPNTVKSLDTLGATSWVAPDQFKALEILSDITARRPAVDRKT